MSKAGDEGVTDLEDIKHDARPRVTAERFLAYSRGVLAGLKDDVALGNGIEQSLIDSIENTIRRHEPQATIEEEDLSRQIDGLKRFGSRAHH